MWKRQQERCHSATPCASALCVRLTRREVLRLGARLAEMASLVPLFRFQGRNEMKRPKIAAVVTEYRLHSHADVIVGKFLEGSITPDGRWEPQCDIVSLYTDQVPPNDMSREMAKKHGVKIFETIEGALTLGTGKLAVDGVLLIGEHGNYPYNEKGQHLYPRRRFFEETVKVFERSGRVVPVFNDKHLSYSWENAKWMYDTAQRMHIPFMAGSSIPVTWRTPPLELPLDCDLQGALALGYGPLESYGFHTLEVLQCMVERRKGGETGVAAVQLLEGDAVWEAGKAGLWSQELLEAGLAVDQDGSASEAPKRVKEPYAFLVEHRDGFRSCALMLNGLVRGWRFAGKVSGQTVATSFRPAVPCEGFPHFARLNDAIQKMFLTGKPTYPVERTLLTTGVLAFAMDSKYQGNQRLETPELAVVYRAA